MAPVSRASDAFANKTGALGMPLCPLVEAVDLELKAVIPEVAEEMTLQQTRGLVGQAAAAG